MNSHQRAPNSRKSSESQNLSFGASVKSIDLNPIIPPAESLIKDKHEIEVVYQIMMKEQTTFLNHEKFRVKISIKKDSCPFQ